MHVAEKSVRVCICLMIGLSPLTFANGLFYPELRSDLQEYQDASKCYPNVGEWYLMYRNYEVDAIIGGTAKCVKYSIHGSYENFSTSAMFTFGRDGYTKGKLTLSSTDCYIGKNVKTFVPQNNNYPEEWTQIIYMNCETCFVARHPYAKNGLGCSLWRRSNNLYESAYCCEFIFDQNCGASRKYYMYNPTCTWTTTTETP
uniref:Putative lipocal-1 1 n=1 Tax=Rhipicephalus microplus TaxID=6941 RepID=A0A6M2CQL6_RHIMP